MVPIPNPRGLAGVEEGVVLPRPPKNPDLGAAGAAERPEAGGWFVLPKRPVGAAEVAVGVLFASLVLLVAPRLNSPEPGAELAKGAEAGGPDGVLPKRLGAAVEVFAAEFAPPNKDKPD